MSAKLSTRSSERKARAKDGETIVVVVTETIATESTLDGTFSYPKLDRCSRLDGRPLNRTTEGYVDPYTGKLFVEIESQPK